jgi:hypothetical protein
MEMGLSIGRNETRLARVEATRWRGTSSPPRPPGLCLQDTEPSDGHHKFEIMRYETMRLVAYQP